MPRNKEDLEKITIRLHNGDKARLDEYHPQLGHNKVIRSLVRKYLKNLDAKLEERRETDAGLNPDELTDITLD